MTQHATDPSLSVVAAHNRAALTAQRVTGPGNLRAATARSETYRYNEAGADSGGRLRKVRH